MFNDILLFIRDTMNHNSLNIWVELIAEQLKKRGVNIHYLNLAEDPQSVSANLISILSTHHIDAALAVNSIGQQNYEIDDGVNLWDDLHIPFIDYIVDHPLEHLSEIRCSCAGYHLICVDQDHVSFVERYLKNVKSASFLPLAGLGESLAAEDIETFSARKYDVVLTAGLFPPHVIKEEIMKQPEQVRNLALLWIEHMETHPELNPEAALFGMLTEKSGPGTFSSEDLFNVCTMCYPVIPYIRTRVREKVVEALIKSGLELHIWGTGWEELNAKYPGNNAVLHGDIPMTDTIELYRNTKLAINILPMFKMGTHDRISTAQINGAAVISDGNEYLRSLYRPDELFTFDLSDMDSLPDRIRSILGDPNTLYETAVNGQTHARDCFTWDAAGDNLYAVIDRIVHGGK